MAEAQFMPSKGRDLFGENISLMERVNQDRRAEQQAQMAQQQFQILQPVLQAKAQADIVSAGASVANATRMEQFRAKAAADSPTFNQEFLDALQLSDFDAQSAALAGLQAKVAYMEVLPEYKGFVSTVNDARVKAHASAITNMKLEEQSQMAREAVQGRITVAQQLGETRAQLEQQKIDARTALETQTAQHRQELEGVKAGFVAQNASSKAKGAGSYKTNQAAVDAGIQARPVLAQIDTALQLLDDPDVRTGTGAQFQLKAERLGNMLGADFKGVEKTEQLQALLGQSLLAKARELRGPISDKDITFLNQISPGLTKTAEGNKQILSALKKGYENAANIARMVNDLRAQGEDEIAISEAVSNYALNNSIWGQSPSGTTSSPSGSTSQSSGFTPEKERRLQELKAKLGR